jgi:hypothetical protein
MTEQDRGDLSPTAPEPRPVPATPKRAPRKRDLAETTGYVAGRTATGLTRMLLRSKTVRETLRNARDANREDD